MGSNTRARASGDALLLTARKLAGPTVAEARPADHVEGALDALLDLGRAEAPHLSGKARFSRDRHVREQRVVLEHDADIAPVRRHALDALAVKGDRPAVGGSKPASIIRVVVLPEPGGPEQRQELAATDAEIEVPDDQAHPVEALFNAAEFDMRTVVAITHRSESH